MSNALEDVISTLTPGHFTPLILFQLNIARYQFFFYKFLSKLSSLRFVGILGSNVFSTCLICVNILTCPAHRFGRKNTFIITAVMGSVFGIAKSFACYYWLYIFFEMSEAFIGDLCSACFMFGKYFYDT